MTLVAVVVSKHTPIVPPADSMVDVSEVVSHDFSILRLPNFPSQFRAFSWFGELVLLVNRFYDRPPLGRSLYHISVYCSRDVKRHEAPHRSIRHYSTRADSQAHSMQSECYNRLYLSFLVSRRRLAQAREMHPLIPRKSFFRSRDILTAAFRDSTSPSAVPRAPLVYRPV